LSVVPTGQAGPVFSLSPCWEWVRHPQVNGLGDWREKGGWEKQSSFREQN
jgi:hypothetical protein